MSNLKVTLTALVFVFFAQAVQANVNETVSSGSAISASVLTELDKSHAELWGLSDDEYLRYQRIMQSPRAYFTPNLDKNPLLALALESKTEQEREKYANRWVQLQFDNNLKVVMWQLQVNKAWQTQFPDVPLFAYKQQGKEQHAIQNMMNGYEAKGKRAKLYISADNCSECDAAFAAQMAALNNGELEGVDVFFTGQESEALNKQITMWAIKKKLSGDDVNVHRTITLNYAKKPVFKVPLVEYE